MVLEMVYNIFSEKSLRSNFLYDHLLKTDNILNDKIFEPFVECLFRVNNHQIQDDLKKGVIMVTAGQGKKSAQGAQSWFNNYDGLVKIIKSSQDY
jgi:hypothetical protein